MISLEQIRTLESKVNTAVSLLAALQEENQQLKAKLAQAKTRIEELEFTVEEYREDQSEIEQGIISALQHLDHLENAVGGLKPQATSTSEAAPSPETAPVIQAAAAEIVEPAPVPVPESIPEPVVPPVDSHWEAPVQQFQQPAPVSEEEYEPAEDEVEEEPQPAPAREQQLDIF